MVTPPLVFSSSEGTFVRWSCSMERMWRQIVWRLETMRSGLHTAIIFTKLLFSTAANGCVDEVIHLHIDNSKLGWRCSSSIGAAATSVLLVEKRCWFSRSKKKPYVFRWLRSVAVPVLTLNDLLHLMHLLTATLPCIFLVTNSQNSDVGFLFCEMRDVETTVSSSVGGVIRVSWGHRCGFGVDIVWLTWKV